MVRRAQDSMVLKVPRWRREEVKRAGEGEVMVMDEGEVSVREGEVVDGAAGGARGGE